MLRISPYQDTCGMTLVCDTLPLAVHMHVQILAVNMSLLVKCVCVCVCACVYVSLRSRISGNDASNKKY